MRKLKLFFACLLMAVLSIGQVWSATIPFTETFVNCTGTNNDFGTSTSSDGNGAFSADNSWTTANPYGANGAAKFGASKKSGSATTPSLTVSSGSSYTLSFNAAPWSNESTTMTVTVTGGTINSSSTATTGTMTTGQWNNYEYTIVASSTSMTIAFSASKNRFFLDEVSITANGSGPADPTINAESEAVAFGTKNIYGKASLTGYVDVAVSGSDLKGNITATLNGTDKAKFSLSGAPFVPTAGSASGTLRVSYNVTAEGDYSASVRLASTDADNVDLPITLKVINQEPVEYIKVTSSKTDWSGEYLIVYEPDATTARIWNGVDAENSYVTTTISSGKVTMPEGATPITITSMTGGYSLLVNGGDNDGKYMQNNGNSNGIKFVDEAQANTITYENNAVTITCGGKMFRYNNASGQDKFRYFGGANQVIQLYKKPVASAVTITNPENGTIIVTKGGNPVTTGTNVAEQSTLNVSIAPVVGYNFTLKAYKTGTPTTVVPIDANGNLTMPDYPITITADETALLAVNIAVNDANMGSATIDGGTATVYKNNDETAALVAVPEIGYEFVNWTAPDGITFDNATALSTTATIEAAGTITANFQAQGCYNLVAPTLNSVTKSYETATIAWNTVEHASSYAVSVVNHTTSVNVFSGDVTELSKVLTDLAANTQYDYTIMAKGDGSTYCDDSNPTLAGSFTTDEYPAATLTLSDAEGTSPFPGDHKLKDVIQLPSTAASCSKTFVGWSTNGNCSTAPEYAKGANFTLSATSNIVYAVYADETPGAETKVTDNIDLEFTGVSGTSYVAWASSKTGTSGAVYTGVNAGGNSAIQLRSDVASTKPASGIISTTSGGKAKKITITWNSNTADDRTLNVFGSNTAYTEVADLVDDNKKGTLLGTVVNGTSTILEIAGNYQYIGVRSNSGAMYLDNIAIEWAQAGEPSYTNYSTTCAAAPTAEADATDVAALVNVDAAGTNGTVAMTYTNVNLEGVVVALFNDEACTQDFDGDWLSASVEGNDKHIAYTIYASTSYKNARTAYIKLTAPAEVAGPAPAVVIIPVSQVKKPAVFASLAELAEADVAANTNVTVTLTNEVIKEIYIYNYNRRGLVFNVQKDNEDVKIYFNADVPAAWVAGGKVSGTLTDCPWKIYSGAWQLAPSTGFVWNVNLTYTAPPAIESIEIRGNANQKTYIDGQVFNPAGLSVIAIYDDNITEEDVTEFATWTYNPAKLSESDTEVTVTATYNEKSDDETVTGLTVNPIPNKTIAQFIAASGTRCYLEGTVGTIDNTKYGNFNLTDASGTIYVYGCLTPEGVSQKFDELGVSQGDRIKVIAEAYTNHATKGHEAVNVVFVSKVSAATIDIDDINMTEGDELLLSDIVATITPGAAQSATINYEVTEGTAVTISEGKIIASTEGEATITASIAAGEGYLAGSTTFTVTVSAAPAPFVGDYFVKVDDNSDLTAGEYLIVYKDGSLAFNGGLDPLDATSNYVAVTFENGKIQGKAEVLAATFTVKLAGGTIQSKSGYYIGRLGNSNGLNSSTEEAYTNTISIDENGDAVILASGGAYLRYNSASGQERFRYFKSDSYTGQKAIQLYKKENAEPVYETVRENLTANRYYTVCLPKKVTAIKGASFWTLNNKSQDGATAYLEEETNNLPFEAGKPFIIQATAENLEVVYEGAATEDAGTNGALHGTLVYMDAAALAAAGTDVYMLFSNELRPVGENNHLDANRAYVLLSELNAVTEAPQGAPGKRVRAMPMQPQVATGMDALNASDAPVKVMIDGKLFIIRGEKMYDATGKLVK